MVRVGFALSEDVILDHVELQARDRFGEEW